MATYKEWAMKMIPVLVRWAQSSWDKPHYYSQLSKAVGLKTSQIGGIMGTIQDILDDVKEQTGWKDIPPLNGLVQSKETNLPSDGFDYIVPDYSKLSFASKKGEVHKLNEKAHKYEWARVLDFLNLKPAIIFEKEDLAKLNDSSNHGYGGEGKEHKAIKEYIKTHPEAVALKNIIKSSTEYDLPSGDRLDVYFESKKNIHYAIEVKPKSSLEGDIIRGIFQCVKYKVVMDAARVLDNGNYDNEVLLVVAGQLSEKAKLLANDLNISFIDNFSIGSYLLGETGGTEPLASRRDLR